MPLKAGAALIVFALAAAFLTGCSKSDQEYRSGMHWLEKEGNPQMAARAFRRSLEADPADWKTHAGLLQALAQSAEADEFEVQLKKTLTQFPEKSRAKEISEPATDILGYERYDRIAAAYEMKHYGDKIARSKDDIRLLARAVRAACRARDTVAAVDWFARFVRLARGVAPDSVRLEMAFFLGAPKVETLELDWQVAEHPDDMGSRRQLVKAAVLAGDLNLALRNLSESFKRTTDKELRDELAMRYGRLAGFDPFGIKRLCKGWDGLLRSDSDGLVYVKDVGRDSPDIYLYTASPSGSDERPILKAYQQALAVVAWPKPSSDGRWIYFYASDEKGWALDKGGRFQLYRAPPRYGAAPQRLTADDLLPVEPLIRPDGSALLVRRDVGSVRQSVEIIRATPAGRTEQISRIGEPTIAAAFTPDGDSLLFLTDRGLFRRSVEGGAITVDLMWKGFTHLQLSPDGGLLWLVSNDKRGVLVEREGGEIIYVGRVASPVVNFINRDELLATLEFDGARWVCKLTVSKLPDSGAKLAALFSKED